MNDDLLKLSDGERLSIPSQACSLREAIDSHIDLALSAEEKGPTRFTMLAHSGAVIERHWYWGNLGIDLSGVQMKQRTPALKDHDSNQRIGYTESLKVVPGRGLVAEGKMLKNANANEVIADSQQGFPWQASVYLQAKRVQVLAQDEESTVNGLPIKGPGAIFRESALREVTFTALGADQETSATTLSADAATVEATIFRQTRNEPMTTNVTHPASPPAAPAAPEPDVRALLAQAGETARADERARTASILAACGDTQRELGLKLVKEGAAVMVALLAINEDLRTRLAAKISALPGSTVPLSNGNTDPAVAAAKAQASAMHEGEAKWAAEFAADASLRAEFMDDVKLYASYKRHQSQVLNVKDAKQAEEG